jgi:excisionase family DNA binding protein
MKAKTIEKEFLSIDEITKLLGISRRTVHRMISRGELKAGKAGTRTIIKRAEIDKLFT